MRVGRSRPRRARLAAEFAFAVPFVMAHRMARMARYPHSRRDRAELSRMVTEKAAAFQASWAAMAIEAMRVQQHLALAYWRASLRVVSRGFLPVQQRAIANARRLSARPTRPRRR